MNVPAYSFNFAFRSLFASSVVFLLVGCAQSIEHGFSPGDDPLVRKLFEKRMDDAGITWTVNSGGLYSSDEIEDMQRLSNSAWEDARDSISIVAESDCALGKFLHSIDESRVVYVIDQDSTGALVRMTSKDSIRIRAMELYAQAGLECLSIEKGQSE